MINGICLFDDDGDGDGGDDGDDGDGDDIEDDDVNDDDDGGECMLLQFSDV